MLKEAEGRARQSSLNMLEHVLLPLLPLRLQPLIPMLRSLRPSSAQSVRQIALISFCVAAATAAAPNASAQSSLAWADWSGDGKLDAFAIRPDGSGVLLRNSGDGTFEDCTNSAGLRPDPVSHAAFGDADGDGRLDLFLSLSTGRCRLLLQGDPGDFVDITSASGLDGARPTKRASWFDFDGDGAMDLHVTGLRVDTLYRGLGRALFEKVDLDGAIGLPASISHGISLADKAIPSAESAPAGLHPPTSQAGISSTNIALPPAASAGNGIGICAATIEDLASGSCLTASSVPQLGSLYPLSAELFVHPSGFVGIGTTSPTSRLDVVGTVKAETFTSTAVAGVAPFSVNSSEKVIQLNADLLDGLSAAAFRSAGAAITSADVLDGSLVNQDIAAGASIDGTKINPTFGFQEITSTSRADITGPVVSGEGLVRGAQDNLSVYGSLAVQGGDLFEGVPTANYNGQEIGVVGISAGTSVDDNYGIVGHSNHVGVRGEHSLRPDDNYGELGKEGIGVFGTGEFAAARFEGLVQIDSDTDAILANSQGDSLTASISSNGPTSPFPALAVNSNSDRNGHDLSRFRRLGDGMGSAIAVQVESDTGLGDGLTVVNDGSGYGAHLQSMSGEALRVDRRDNAGTILSATNGADVEFRVDSTGNVFCDGQFSGGGADYAEWLPKEDPNAVFRRGDVVGVFGGKISHRVSDAEHVLVISSNPVLVGNACEAELNGREHHEVVAFLGQVPVRTRGAVSIGDFLIPSGHADGTARAVAPAELSHRDIGRVLGRAWEAASPGASGELHSVNAAIGLDRASVAAGALKSMEERLRAVEHSLEVVLERVERLDATR